MAISKEEFGSRMHDIREKTVNEAADHISIELQWSDCYVSDVETGKHYPSMERFMKLMDYYDLPYSCAFECSSGAPTRIAAYMGRIMKLSPELQELACNIIEGMINNLETQENRKSK